MRFTSLCFSVLITLAATASAADTPSFEGNLAVYANDQVQLPCDDASNPLCQITLPRSTVQQHQNAFNLLPKFSVTKKGDNQYAVSCPSGGISGVCNPNQGIYSFALDNRNTNNESQIIQQLLEIIKELLDIIDQLVETTETTSTTISSTSTLGSSTSETSVPATTTSVASSTQASTPESITSIAPPITTSASTVSTTTITVTSSADPSSSVSTYTSVTTVTSSTADRCIPRTTTVTVF